MAHRISLTLIRHLPTVGNQRRQYIGWTDESIVRELDKIRPFHGNPKMCTEVI